MNASVFVKKGLNKANCDDVVLAGEHICNNENRVYHIPLEAPYCIGIADGVGGNRGGKDAALFVCNAICDNVKQLKSQEEIEAFLVDMNRELLKQSSMMEDKQAMATTFSGILFTGEAFFLIHIGNTRVYVKQRSYLKQITEDHTTYQWLIGQGLFEQAEKCNKNEITACFGGGNSDCINLLTVTQIFEKKSPSVIIMTSDGVHEYVDYDTMEELMLEMDEPDIVIEKLIDISEGNQSMDDKSIIVIQL